MSGGRLTLWGIAESPRRDAGADDGVPGRTFVLRERDKPEQRRFHVEPGTGGNRAAFCVQLDLASRDCLPPREAVWDAYVDIELGDVAFERRVAASLAALPEAVTISARGSAWGSAWGLARGLARGRRYQVVPYTTKHGNLSFRIAPAPRSRRTEEMRRWLLRRTVKPPARAAARAAMRVLRARDGRRAHRLARTPPQPPSTHAVHILLMHAYGMGGTIRTVHNLAGYLARDHAVTLYSVVRKVDEPFFPFPDGVTVVPLDDRTARGRPRGVTGLACRLFAHFPSVLVHMEDGAYQTSSLWTDVQLFRTIRGLRSGVLITTRPALNLLAALFAPPGVVTVGQEHMNFGTHRPGLRRAIRRNYRRLDALVVLTEKDRTSYQQVLSSARTRLLRIPNAVPRLDGGLADLDSKVVVAAGRLGNQKGFDMLVRAFAGVKARHPDWRLRIYGSGPWRDRLRRMIANYGLFRHVSLMGRAPDMGGELAKASIFALSSRFEGFPMVLIEAMSKGLPVVAFDCPTGPAEVVTPDNGVLVGRENVDAFGAALSALMEDAGRRHACGAGARKTARDYDLSVVGARWRGLFDELSAGS